MKIQTKSIQSKKSKSDGVRICIMRRVKPEFEFDMWIPALAPSTKLLAFYHDGKVDWGEFSKKYKKEVFGKQDIYLNIIGDLANEKNVTILCWEKKGENCHRFLVTEKLKEIYPELSVKHV